MGSGREVTAPGSRVSVRPCVPGDDATSGLRVCVPGGGPSTHSHDTWRVSPQRYRCPVANGLVSRAQRGPRGARGHGRPDGAVPVARSRARRPRAPPTAPGAGPSFPGPRLRPDEASVRKPRARPLSLVGAGAAEPPSPGAASPSPAPILPGQLHRPLSRQHHHPLRPDEAPVPVLPQQAAHLPVAVGASPGDAVQQQRPGQYR